MIKHLYANVAMMQLLFLLSLTCSANENKPTEIEQIILTFNEVSYYFSASLAFYTALEYFNQQYGTKNPEITCKSCHAPFRCEDLIIKLQGKAMDKAIGAPDSTAHEAREKMFSIFHEITHWLFYGSLDDVRNFMVKIAQNDNIQCEDCQKITWQPIGINA